MAHCTESLSHLCARVNEFWVPAKLPPGFGVGVTDLQRMHPREQKGKHLYDLAQLIADSLRDTLIAGLTSMSAYTLHLRLCNATASLPEAQHSSAIHARTLLTSFTSPHLISRSVQVKGRRTRAFGNPILSNAGKKSRLALSERRIDPFLACLEP